MSGKKNLDHTTHEGNYEDVKWTIRFYLILAVIYLIAGTAFIIESIKETNPYKLWIGIALLILTIYKVVNAVGEAKKHR